MSMTDLKSGTRVNVIGTPGKIHPFLAFILSYGNPMPASALASEFPLIFFVEDELSCALARRVCRTKSRGFKSIGFGIDRLYCYLRPELSVWLFENNL